MIKMRKITVESEPVYDGDELVDMAQIGEADIEEVEFEADEYDLENGKSDASICAHALRGFESSGSHFAPHNWYSDSSTDFRDGNQTEISYHFDELTPVEIRKAVWSEFKKI